MKSVESSIEFPSPLDQIRATATDRGVSSLQFVDRAKSRASADSSNPHLQKLRAQLDRYFDGKLRKFTVRLDLSGTPFRLSVWKELSRIPHGETISYVELAPSHRQSESEPRRRRRERRESCVHHRFHRPTLTSPTRPDLEEPDFIRATGLRELREEAGYEVAPGSEDSACCRANRPCDAHTLLSAPTSR